MADPAAPDSQFSQDAEDRRAAFSAAIQVALATGNHADTRVIADASYYYAWLRRRDTLRAVTVQILPTTPVQEGTIPMATSFSLEDNQQVTFSIDGKDAKGADVPSPSDSWSWSLADPDNSGAVLTPSADTLTAVVAAGTPTANLVLSASGATTGLAAQCAISVTAGPATGIDLVPGDPAAV